MSITYYIEFYAPTFRQYGLKLSGSLSMVLQIVRERKP